MSGQALLKGDLASQWPSPFQSCRALLYLQIRRCLAKPLYCLAFYLKVKADLAPVTLSLSVGLSVHLSVTVSYACFCIRLCICLSLLPLSELFCLPLSLLCRLFPRPFSVLCIPCSLVFHAYTSLHIHTHTHTHLITTASVQHSCLVGDVCAKLTTVLRDLVSFTLPLCEWSRITFIEANIYILDTTTHTHLWLYTHTHPHTVKYNSTCTWLVHGSQLHTLIFHS